MSFSLLGLIERSTCKATHLFLTSKCSLVDGTRYLHSGFWIEWLLDICVTISDLSQYPNILQYFWINDCILKLSQYCILLSPNTVQGAPTGFKTGNWSIHMLFERCHTKIGRDRSTWARFFSRKWSLKRSDLRHQTNLCVQMILSQSLSSRFFSPADEENVSQVTSRLNPNLISWGHWGGDVHRACDAYPTLYDCSCNLFPIFWPALYKWLRNDRPTRRSFRDHIKWSFPYKMNFQKIFPSIVSIGFFRDDIFCDFLRDRIVWRIVWDWKTRLYKIITRSFQMIFPL